MLRHPPTLPATHPLFITQCLLWSLLVLFTPSAQAADTLSLPAVSDGNYRLSWSIADANTYSEVFERKNSGAYVSIDMQDGGTGHIDFKNKADGRYYYKVVGCYTGPASAVCTRSPTVTGRITVGPQTPAKPSASLSRSAKSGVSFTLSWYPVDFAHYYQWRVREGNGAPWGSAQRSTAVSVRHRQTKAGVYHYALRACGKADHCSAWSTAQSITITRAAPPEFGGDTDAPHFSQQGEQVRATQGQYTVSHGSLSYDVPLKLPTLPGGMRPDIRMAINSVSGTKKIFITPEKSDLSICYVKKLGEKLNANSGAYLEDLASPKLEDTLDLTRLCYQGATLRPEKGPGHVRDRPTCRSCGETRYTARTYWAKGTVYYSPQDPKLRITLVSDKDVTVDRGNGERYLYQLSPHYPKNPGLKRDSQGVVKLANRPSLSWSLVEMRNAYGATITFDYSEKREGSPYDPIVYMTATYSNGYQVDVGSRVRGDRGRSPELVVYKTAGGSRQPIRLYYTLYANQNILHDPAKEAVIRWRMGEIFDCGFPSDATQLSSAVCALPLKPKFEQARFTQFAFDPSQNKPKDFALNYERLRSVEDGFGNVTTFEYADMNDTSVFPKARHSNATGVVTRISERDGNTYGYYYGRPILSIGDTAYAFRSITKVNEHNFTYEKTVYDFSTGYNHLPLIERVEQGVTNTSGNSPKYHPDGALASEITTYGYKSHVDAPWYAYRAKATTQHHHLTYQTDRLAADHSGSFSLHSPDAVENPLRYTTKITREEDRFGTETKRVTATYEALNDVKTHETTYEATDVDHNTKDWLLGFVKDTTTADIAYENGGALLNKKIVRRSYIAQAGTTEVRVSTLYDENNTDVLIKETTERNSRGLVTAMHTRAKNTQGQSETRTTRYGDYDTHGFPAYTENAKGHRSTMAYDLRFGEQRSVTDANGLTQTTDYSPFGEVVTQTNPRGVSTNSIDFYCSRAQVACPSGALYGQATTVTHPDSAAFGAPTTIIYYDRLGRNKGDDIITPTGDHNRVLRSHYADGRLKTQSTRTTRTARRKTHRYYWYSNGRTWGSLNASGVMERYQYRMKITQLNTGTFGEASVEAIDEVRFTRLATGNRIQRRSIGSRDSILGVTDALGSVVSYQYDAHDNVTDTIVNSKRATRIHIDYNHIQQRTLLNDPDAGFIGFDYTGFGELKSQTWAPGKAQAKSIAYYYDVLGRKTKRTDKAADGETSDFLWEWDKGKKGLLDAARSHIGRDRTDYPPEYREDRFYKGYTYNALGEVKQTREWGSYYVSESGAFYFSSANMTLTYDDFGREKETTYPGLTTRKRYYGSGFPLDLSETSGGTRRIYRHSDDSFNGEQSKTLYGNDVVSTRRYNALGQLTDIESGRHSDDGLSLGKETQDLAYGYYDNGNLKSRRSITPARDTTETFTYDALNRVKTASLAGYNYLQTHYNNATKHHYNYDKLGNLIYRSDKGIVSNNSASAQNIFYGQTNNAGVHAATHAFGKGSQRTGQVNYAYDAYGNVISRDGNSLKYDVFNKPTQIDNVHFGYGADHARYVQYKEGRAVFYLFGGRYKNIQTGDPNRPDNEYVLTIDGAYQHKRIEKRGASKKTERRFLHSDHLGSVNAVTNEQGQVVSRAQYNVWGEQIVQTGSGLKALATDMGFTGHETLSDSGLVHMNGRVYDPTIARFMSADLYIQAPFNTQSYNRYTYVFNNPLGYTDPTGYQADAQCSNIDTSSCIDASNTNSVNQACIDALRQKCEDDLREAEKEEERRKERDDLQKEIDRARARQKLARIRMYSAYLAGDLNESEYAQFAQALAEASANLVQIALAVNKVSSGKAKKKAGTGSGKHAQEGGGRSCAEIECVTVTAQRPKKVELAFVTISSAPVTPRWIPIQYRPVQNLGRYGNFPKRHKNEGDGAYSSRIQRYMKWQKGETHTSGGRGAPGGKGIRNPWNDSEGGAGTLLENIIKSFEPMGGSGAVVPMGPLDLGPRNNSNQRDSVEEFFQMCEEKDLLCA